MARGSASYEVQVYQVDHWVLDSCFDVEAEALAHGKRLIANGRIEGVRVVRDWRRADGRHTETELHTEFRAASRAVVIAPIDDASPPCQTVEQCYGVESRMVMNRLLRHYVERAVVTPTELMHNYAELKRLRDKDNLFPTAVGRVAALQAEAAGIDGRGRRDELYGLLDGMTERARAASTRKDLPAVGDTGFRPAFETLRVGSPEPEELGFLGRVVLSRELVQMRNWLVKLDYLSELVREDGGLTDEPLTLVDGVIADVLGAPSVAQELLGTQACLADALCDLIDLSRGRLSPVDRMEEDRALHLSELLAFHDLDETRLVLLDLVRRQLKSTQPLNRLNPGAERDSFITILTRLITPAGVAGGPAMAEAVVQRYVRFLEAGGATGRRQAIGAVVDLIPSARDQLRFLITLADSELGRQHRDDIGGALSERTGSPDQFVRFIDRRKPIRENLEALTGLYRLVMDSALPVPLRTRLADDLDAMLAACIVKSRVVEQIDNTEDPLRTRANRLMQLCAPGTLQSRRALDIVRQRVVAHLRQPNFEDKYVADLADPHLKKQALRDFYRLLGEGGFM